MCLYFHDITIKPQYILKGNRIWLVISIDDLDTPIASADTEMEEKSIFNYEMEIKFTTKDLHKCHIYIQLCCFGEDDEMILLAKSKARIERLPLNCPNAFKIPLISSEDFNELGKLTISGIIEPPIPEAKDD